MRKTAIIALIVTGLFFLSGCAYESLGINAEKGLINLEDYHILKNGPVNMEKLEWECFESAQPEPSAPAGGTHMSGSKFIIPARNSSHVFSTYRMTVITAREDINEYGLYLSGMRACRLWVNGRLLAANDSSQNSGMGGNSTNITAPFIVGQNRVEIIIQTDFFRPRVMVFGTGEQIRRIKWNTLVWNLPIVAVILFMAVYHLFLFLLRKKERIYFYTAVSCFLSALYIASFPPYPVITYVFPQMEDRVNRLLAFFFSYTTAFFFLYYLKAMYPKSIKKYFVLGIEAIAAVFTVLLIYVYAADNVTLLKFLNIVYNPMLIILSGYILAVLIRLSRQARDARLVLAGFLLLVLTAAADSVSQAFFGVSRYYMKYGLFLFMLFLAFRLALVFTGSFNRVEQLSEKLMNLDRLKDDFLMNTAHELKTPMHGIMGIAGTMLEDRRGTVSEEAMNLELIVASIKRLTGLVDNILTFSKMKYDDVALSLKPVSLMQVVNAVFAVLRPMAGEKKIILVNEIEEDFVRVEADENRLFQIMYNLAGNAVKFTSHGEIKASAVVRPDWVEISVSDTGIGISPDKLETIFLPFEQAGTYENMPDTGTGLGLAITRKLVELHGGHIYASSEPDKGSCFYFTLRASGIRAAKAASAANLQPSYHIVPAAGGSTESYDSIISADSNAMRILIADDEPINLRILTDMLKKDSYTILKARSGPEVLQLIEKNQKPDLVILDVMMPQMSGYEVCHRLREKYTLHDLPVLLVTVKNQPSDILAGFEAGANDYLPKPFNDLEMKARIQNLLDLKRAVHNTVAAEMNFLQAQIKPHFLHNTLNVIMSLIRTEPDKARELLMELNNYLRESFRFDETDREVTLQKEMTMVKAYLHIMSARYPGKIQVVYDIDGDIDIRMPRLILQPLVENAVKHGILARREGGCIWIKIADLGREVNIAVKDNGTGIREELIPLLLNEKVAEAGIGIVNVNKRLKHQYGKGLRIESSKGEGTLVEFSIPRQGGEKLEGNIAG